MRPFALLFFLLSCVLLRAQSLEDRSLRSLRDFYEFLSIPNDAKIAGQLEDNLIWLEGQLVGRSFKVERLANEGTDLLLASMESDKKNAPTVLFYGHLDGQSVDPSKWALGPPFQPILGQMSILEDGSTHYEALQALPEGEALREARLFARSASDAKGPIMMFLVAWDHFIANGGQLAYNLKIIIDTEEEIGSPKLAAAVKDYQAKLAADHLIILDGPVHPSGQPTLVFGARGIASARLTVYGPKRPLHSGHYGNYAPNPALRLAQLLAGMKDEEGRVTIPGWYDGIELDKRTLQQLAAVPDDADAIHQSLGFSEPDAVSNQGLQAALQYPSLNIKGMSSGWVGAGARTIIPATAVANLDIRLVAETDGERMIQLLQKYLVRQGYYLIPEGREPSDEERAKYPKLASFSATASYAAFRTPTDGPSGRWLSKTLRGIFGKPPVIIRTMGGSVPIAPFVNTLAVPAIILPLVNADNNQHSPNENLLLRHYFDGIRCLLGILESQP